MFIVVTVISLLVLGGFIAWAGDVIGYRLGKSRRSLFGLRPRVTARLVGMALGALLPVVGLLVAALASEQARIALFHIEDLRREQTDLKQSNEVLNVQLGTARTTAGKAEQRSRELTLDMAEKERDLKDLRGGLEQVRQRLTAAYANLNKVTAQSAALRNQVTGLQRAKEVLNLTLFTLQRNYSGLLDRYKTAEAKLTDAETRLNRARDEVGKLEDQNKTLSDAAKKLQDTVEELQRQIPDLQAKVDQYQRRLQAITDELDDRRAKLADTQARLQIASRHAGQPFTDQGVILEQGQELVRAIIDGNQNQDQMESTVAALLELTENAARQHRVVVTREGPNGVTMRLPSVRLVGPLPPGIKPTETVSQGRIIAEASRQMLREGARSYVGRMLVVRRRFEDDTDPAEVSFVAVPNRLVFAKGAVVWEAQVDGALARDAVFGQLWNLIPRTRENARAAGLLPNPETQQYGEAPAQQLLDALDRVIAIQGPAIVRAVAERDTHTAEPLVIDLQVRPGRLEHAGE